VKSSVPSTITSGAPSSSVGISYAFNAFGNTPSLTTASFNGLHGLNPNAPDTVNFNGFTPSATANTSNVFFSITNVSTGAYVFVGTARPSSTTSVLIPAGTLTANTAYSYELIYDDRVDNFDLNGSRIATQQLFDTRTFGSFTTAAPEPGYFPILALLSVVMLVNRGRRSAWTNPAGCRNSGLGQSRAGPYAVAGSDFSGFTPSARR
jgi:hypothetical protein